MLCVCFYPMSPSFWWACALSSGIKAIIATGGLSSWPDEQDSSSFGIGKTDAPAALRFFLFVFTTLGCDVEAVFSSCCSFFFLSFLDFLSSLSFLLDFFSFLCFFFLSFLSWSLGFLEGFAVGIVVWMPAASLSSWVSFTGTTVVVGLVCLRIREMNPRGMVGFFSCGSSSPSFVEIRFFNLRKNPPSARLVGNSSLVFFVVAMMGNKFCLETQLVFWNLLLQEGRERKRRA
mmetsp:Transcript_17516/g.40705  ORF Transcript_17516/g.40705 Transcript_17516/m.40705 type:complete len:232 (+) Transcript_17516:242-937(+)